MKKCLYCYSPIQAKASWAAFFGVEAEALLCDTCRSNLELLVPPLCQICGRSLSKLEENFHEDGICRDCTRWEEDTQWQGILTKNRSVYQYNTFLKEVMAQFKYRGDYALGEVFGSQLLVDYRNEFKDSLLVPLPLSEQRLYERGFNQADVLCQFIGNSIPSLIRIKHEEKQSKRNRANRIYRKENPFAVVSHFQKQIESAHIMLVDDIYTTGSTVRYAAKALLDCGAQSVSSLTVARG